MTQRKSKRGRGQPTKYRPEYCSTVIEMGKQGKSIAEMCSRFDISRQTIDNWAEKHPEFLDALMRARTHMQAKLEEMGFTGLGNKEFNANLWKTTMMARFREDYTEQRNVNLDATIEQEMPDIRQLSRAIMAVLGSAVIDGELVDDDQKTLTDG